MPKKNIMSIACHEQPLVIRNQLLNIKKFVPNCQVVLHASADSGQQFKETLIHLSNTEFKDFMFVNSYSYHTHSPHDAGFVTGLTTVHASNFRYINSIISDFEIFAISTSNDMFVRKGMENLFENYKCCTTSYREDIDTYSANCHPNFKAFVYLMQQHIDVKFATQCATEGTYYPKDCFKAFSDIMLDKIGGIIKCEELLVHSIILNLFPELLGSNVGGTFVFHNPQHNETLTQDVLDVRAGKYQHKYSVKRVPRIINNSCRNFINELTKDD